MHIHFEVVVKSRTTLSTTLHETVQQRQVRKQHSNIKQHEKAVHSEDRVVIILLLLLLLFFGIS